MQFLKLFFLGFGMFWKGLSFIFRHRLAWFFFFPLLINLLLWWLGLRSGTQLAQMLTDWLSPFLPDAGHLPIWVQSVVTALKWIAWIVVRIAVFMVVVYVGGFFIMVVLSPVLSWLASVTYRIHTGEDVSGGFWDFLSDIWRGVMVSVRNLVKETLLNLLIFVATFVPVVGFATPMAFFVNSAYFFGASFVDYGVEQHRIGYVKSLLFVSIHKGLALGCGIMYALVLMIPYVGIFLGGFVAMVSVVGATLAVNRMIYIPKTEK
ncbi:MAG: EI24 domain-containing protein [Breznakibacter sp.]